MINSYKFETVKWYISLDTPHIYGKLDTGSYLQSQRELRFFDMEEEYLVEIDKLEVDITGFTIG